MATNRNRLRGEDAARPEKDANRARARNVTTAPTKTHGARINPSLANFALLPADALIDVKTVAVLIGRSVNTAWRMARAGSLPAPIKVGPNSTRWKVGPIRAYLASIG